MNILKGCEFLIERAKIAEKVSLKNRFVFFCASGEFLILHSSFRRLFADKISIEIVTSDFPRVYRENH